jgi:hypothetical protein
VLALNVWSMLSGRFDASDPFIQVMAETMGFTSAGAYCPFFSASFTALIGRECRSMEIMWRPIRVSADSFDEEHQRVLVDGTPAAILVHCTSPFNNPELHGVGPSCWIPDLLNEKPS